MVDPHLLASGVCEKERKSEHNSRASGSQPLRGDEVGSDASLGSRNLNGAVAEAHIHWIFFNLSYMSLYMRILCNLFNRMRSATTDGVRRPASGGASEVDILGHRERTRLNFYSGISTLHAHRPGLQECQ